MRILITGGAGFIGSNFVRYMLKKYPEYEIVVLDKLTYAGRKENLQDVMNRIIFIKGDICKEKDVDKAVKNCNAVFNFAAETHVDRSIKSAECFVTTNVLGTYILLEATRRYEIDRYIQISTDEVYGSIEDGSFNENDALEPSSPYSASKAGGDLLCKAYHKTYGLPVLITRSSNNFGPYQYPEKIIPLFITNLLENKKVPIYGDGKNVRDWIYVMDNCSGIDMVFDKGSKGEVYNIGGGKEITNLDLTRKILELMSRDSSYIQYVVDRLGHDRRYSLNFGKIMKLGWLPKYDFHVAIKETIIWYKENEWWWRTLVR